MAIQTTHVPISDDLWVNISPIVLGGVPAKADERPDLRNAIDALNWIEQQLNADAELPSWVVDPATVRVIHSRWKDNGTASLIRRMLRESQPQAMAPATAPPALETSEPVSTPPTNPSQHATRVKTHTAEAVPKADQPRIPEPEPHTLPDPEPDPDPAPAPEVSTRRGAPPTTSPMIEEIERWVEFHYHRAHISDDWFENQLGRDFLPAFHKVLGLMYTHWEVENDQHWPKPHLYEPMPDDDWVNHTNHSRAIIIATQNLDGSFDDIQNSIRQLQEIIIRGTEYRAKNRDSRDRLLRILGNETSAALDQLKATVNRLHEVGIQDFREALVQEEKLDSKPPHTERVENQHKRATDGEYERRAIKWAQEHDGLITPRDLAQNMVDQKEQKPEEFSRLRNSITVAVRRSTMFEKTVKGVYQLKPDETSPKPEPATSGVTST